MAERSVLVRIRGNSNDLIRATAAARRSIGDLRKEIDTTNDRTAWMAQSFLALGPALVPLGATAAPVLAGLATQMTAAGLAAGSTGLAFVGLGDAMKAVDKYQLEPTIENFQAMRDELEGFGPAGAEFVRFLQSVGPQFDQLQLAAREGMFPGMEEGIREFMDILPQVERVVLNVSDAIGTLSEEAGAGLAGSRFTEFFEYIENEAAPILLDMGRTAGNLADGFGSILVAFGPLTKQFSDGFLNMSRDFAKWAHGLDDSASFTEFVDYIRDSTPKVLDLLSSLAAAFLQIAEAAAPVGDVLLPVLARFLDVIGAIADTPLGPAFIAAGAAMSIYGRAAALASITTGGLGKKLFGLGDGLGAAMRGTQGAVAKMGALRAVGGRAAGGIGVLALSMTDLDDKMGIANTAMGVMAGLMVAGPWGAAIGGAIGLTADLAAGQKDAAAEVARLADTFDRQTGAITENTRAEANSKAQKDGLLDAAAKLGIAESDVTDSILGSADATARINAEIAEHDLVMGATVTSAEDLSGAYSKQEIAAIMLDRAAFDLSEGLPGLQTQFRGAHQKAEQFARGMGHTTGVVRKTGQAVADFRDEIERANRVLSRRGSFRDYEAALDDLADTLDDTKHKARLLNDNGTINIEFPKGREVQEQLDAIAEAAIKVSENLKGADKIEFLAQARRDFIAAAMDIGLSRKAARNLADDLKLLDRTRALPAINLDTSRADAHLAAFLGRMADLKDKTVHIYVKRHGDGGGMGSGTGFGPVGNADGGTIGGPRQPYGDKVLSWLAPGEEVISNRHGQADRHRDLLRAINANRYADGGTISVHATASLPAGFPAQSGPPIDYDRLAVAMSRVRPLYGDVQVTDGYGGFKRQMMADRQAAGLGGV